ncbi:unnamed protein product [Sphenostylis stenocarpa]|uniref:Uncharacterized protein n=1 Tax=Sphenostylis stenocarpa TaxID=92480 RepID=A0AA86S5M9_9FABA|nr:unnamed protein product [Sphenostylis stenocarpa]
MSLTSHNAEDAHDVVRKREATCMHVGPALPILHCTGLDFHRASRANHTGFWYMNPPPPVSVPSHKKIRE